MRAVLFILVLVFLSSCAIFRKTRTAEKGVEISGIYWASRNVGEIPGTFAENAESAGGHFSWEEAQEVCPEGWRLPTIEELSALKNTRVTWMRVNDVGGWAFGKGENQIFIPAVGFENPLTDTMDGKGESGFYWSNSPHGITVHYLFLARDMVTAEFRLLPQSRMSVRCVK